MNELVVFSFKKGQQIIIAQNSFLSTVIISQLTQKKYYWLSLSHRPFPPPLPSLPRPLCNQIPKFRSNPGPSQGSPPPPTACGGPAGVLRSVHDPAGASWSWGLLGTAGQSQPRPHPAVALSGHMGPPWGRPPSPRPRCPPHLQPELQGLFPPLKSWIGHQAAGWGGLDKGGE